MMTRGGAGAVLSETGERRGVRGAPDVEEPADSLAFGVAAVLLAGAAGVADDPLEDFVGCLVLPSDPALFVLNWVVLAGLLSTFTSSGACSTWARGREDIHGGRYRGVRPQYYLVVFVGRANTGSASHYELERRVNLP